MGAMLTPEGGLAVQMTNKTGLVSQKGMLVACHSDDEAVKLVTQDIPNAIGAIYNDGVADGDQVWVVVSGLADVLIEDGTAATAGYWAKVSDNQDGRADISNAMPDGGTIVAIEDHMSEIGHGVSSAASGTDVLARVNLHFS